MLILLDIRKLKERARASGIALQDICRLAGVSVSTPCRLARHAGSGRTATMVKLNLALAEIERQRRDRLASLPPLGTGHQPEEAVA